MTEREAYITLCELHDIAALPTTGQWRSHHATLTRRIERERQVVASGLSRAAKSHEIAKTWGEPAPIPTDERPVWDAVIEDMKSRDRFGREKYGTPLQVSNGRDPLKDAYEEVLDLAVYLKQEIMKREQKNEQGTEELGEPASS